MRILRRWKIWGILALSLLIFGFIFVWHMGSVLVAPANHPVGKPPPDLPVENVEFSSPSGAMIHGWLIAGKPGNGAVALMHGIHADRTTLVSRAKFLSQAGYTVLLFDFQGHGESLGKRITFGYLESRDSAAAVAFLQHRCPGEKIGVIGISMGAAAALLSTPQLPVDAMVLESSYPTIYQATEDRLVMRFGWLGKLGAPLLICQLRPRLGIGAADLQPLESARRVTVPKFFIAGTADRDTTIEEAQSLFAAAANPKQAWWVDGAGHVDLHAFAGKEYENRVLAFLARHLRQH